MNLDSAVRVTGKVTRGMLLTLWFFALIALALAAATEQFSTLLVEWRHSGSYYSCGASPFNKMNLDAQALNDLDLQRSLEAFVAAQCSTEPLPIDSLLSRLVPTWQADLQKSAIPAADSRARIQSEANALFEKTKEVLVTLAAIKADPNTKKISLLEIATPAIQAQESSSLNTEKDLPDPVRSWLQQKEDLAKEDSAKLHLFDTFFLLIALGAFGSLIFLTRDYITKATKAGYESYVFSPVLGMFLAVAALVIDIGTQTIVATPDLQNLNMKTLYVLALAAGLFSERVYSYIEKQVDEVIDKDGNRKKDGKDDDRHGGGANSDADGTPNTP